MKLFTCWLCVLDQPNTWLVAWGKKLMKKVYATSSVQRFLIQRAQNSYTHKKRPMCTRVHTCETLPEEHSSPFGSLYLLILLNYFWLHVEFKCNSKKTLFCLSDVCPSFVATQTLCHFVLDRWQTLSFCVSLLCLLGVDSQLDCYYYLY